jgi:hypothetical protein
MKGEFVRVGPNQVVAGYGMCRGEIKMRILFLSGSLQRGRNLV